MLTRIIHNTRIFGGYYHLEIKGEGIGKAARPGQFFMLKVGFGTDPLLRRPFSLHRVVSPDSVEFLYRDVGRGTRLLARMASGDELDVLGPLGKGFKVGKGVEHALLVAGGIGVAPILGLAEHIVKRCKGVKAVTFIGGRGRDDVLAVGEFRRLGLKTYVSTEDGSLPRKGLITDSLEEYIRKYARHGTKGWTVYSCGPKAMLMSVAALAKRHGIRNYTSLESNMACGIGACMGCVVSVLDREHGSAVYKKVCEDGPVFDAEDVIW